MLAFIEINECQISLKELELQQWINSFPVAIFKFLFFCCHARGNWEKIITFAVG